MADNKRSKKLIGGIIGGATGVVGGVVSKLFGKKKKSLPSAANSLLGKVFNQQDSLDSGKTITDQDTATTEEKRNKKLGFLADRNPVAGAILPNGGVGILTKALDRLLDKDSVIDVIEIDSEMIEIAKNLFFFTKSE